MAINPSRRTPKLCLHKPTGQGYVRIDGVCRYLGKFEDPATQERAHRLLAEWLANGYRVPVAPNDILVEELLEAYWLHCQEWYRRPDGTPSDRTLGGIGCSLAVVRNLYSQIRAVNFGPLALRACREKWIIAGLRRTTVNKRVSEVKRAFKWAASLEMIPAATFHALTTVEGLKMGRTKAKESRVVTAVAEAHINAIEGRVSQQVWGLVRLQLLTGARSGEILMLRRRDLDTSGPVWTVKVEAHKTSYRGRDRTLYLGPQAQALLKEFFPGKGPVDFLFSPKDAVQERHAACDSHRHQPVVPAKTQRTLGDCYTANSYRRAIIRACMEIRKDTGDNNFPLWHPHQLRHTCATRLRKEFGLDAAAKFLGHARCDVTQVYAHLDASQAIELARQVG